jgi:TPP-dependent indolepyruvate ferredoxin oxidoreductase alpha subunit
VFLGSYPITPASDILHELSKHKNFGMRTLQAEDEIAGGAALGAAFGGHLGVTTTSGPGVALKSETMARRQPRAAAGDRRHPARWPVHRSADQDRGRPT